MIRWCAVPEIWCVTDVIVISHFGLFFTPLYPTSPKNQNFEKMKKMPGDIIILHMCTKNYDHMMYGSWDMLRDGRTERRKDGRIDGRTDGKSDIQRWVRHLKRFQTRPIIFLKEKMIILLNSYEEMSPQFKLHMETSSRFVRWFYFLILTF